MTAVAMMTTPKRIGQQRMPQCGGAKLPGDQVGVRDLIGHPDGERKIGQVGVLRWVVFFEVHSTPRSGLEMPGVARREHGVNDRPGQRNRADAQYCLDDLGPRSRTAQQEQAHRALAGHRGNDDNDFTLMLGGGRMLGLAVVQGPDGEPHPPDDEPSGRHPPDEEPKMPRGRE